MNVRLKYSYDFTAGVWMKDTPPVFNSFNLKLYLITASFDMVDQNIAFDRMSHFVQEVIHNSFFIHQDEVDTIAHLEAAGIRTIALPEMPFEQVIGLMFYRKLNAIMEERMFLTDIQISSTYGQNVVYMYSGEEIENVFDTNGWWEDPELSWRDKAKVSSKKKIVELPNASSISWKDVGLQWEDEDDNEESNDDDSTEVERPSVGVVVKFKPDPT